MSEIVTIFRNIRETETPFHRSVAFVLTRIKEGASKDLVTRIRKENDKASRNEIKKELPAVCFSGIFNKRSDAAVQEHSGFICLDFDGYATKKDMKAERNRLEKDRYIYSVFTSPSGNGLKALVRIPQDADNHTSYFNALEKHFNSDHFDKTCKNVSRVCYESYDPLIYINEKSELWTGVVERHYVEVEVKTDTPTIPITDDNKVVDILVKWWEKKYGMVDGERNANVFKLAMAFNDFGINKSLASHILRQYEQPDFKVAEIERTLDSAYSHTANHGTRYYEDSDRINNIKAQLKRGVSKKEVRSQLKGEVESEVVEAVLERVERENEEQTFWLKTEKGVIKIVPLDFKTFLEDNGFYKYAPEGSKNYVFVKVTNNPSRSPTTSSTTRARRR